jgi:hypothetical protein
LEISQGLEQVSLSESKSSNKVKDSLKTVKSVTQSFQGVFMILILSGVSVWMLL